VTVPGHGGVLAAFAAELGCTFLLVLLILTFVDRPRLLPWTAAAAGLLVATLVFVEAPVSGTSLNPARTIAPALVATVGTGLWLYLVAPPVGALGAVTLRRRLGRPTIACGKLVHPDDVPCHFLDCQYTPPERRIRRSGRR
jgi:aquaporin Z